MKSAIEVKALLVSSSAKALPGDDGAVLDGTLDGSLGNALSGLGGGGDKAAFDLINFDLHSVTV